MIYLISSHWGVCLVCIVASLVTSQWLMFPRPKRYKTLHTRVLLVIISLTLTVALLLLDQEFPAVLLPQLLSLVVEEVGELT